MASTGVARPRRLPLTVLLVVGGLIALLVGAEVLMLVVATVIAVPVMLTGARIGRAEGGLFVVAYLGYLGWLLATRT